MSSDARFSEGQRRYPGIALRQEEFLEHVESLGEGVGDDPDLFLAAACLHGTPGALEELERSVWSQVPLYVASLRLPGDALEELRQELRARVLVGSEGAPARLTHYLGQGPLGAWVRVAALRLGLDRAQQPVREKALEQAPALAAPVDPELAYVRERYAEHYQAALEDALKRLSTKDRSLLRLSVVDGLGIDALARIHQVHRATAARWLSAAREQLVSQTYALLGERLRIPASELQSLAALVRSQLHLSLARLLEPRSNDEPL